MLKKLSFIFSTVPLFHRCSAITGGRSGSAKGKKGKRERGGRKKEKYRSQNEIPTKDKAATLYLTCTRDAIKYYNEVLVTERGGGDPTTHAHTHIHAHTHRALPTSLFRHRIIDSRFFSSCFRASSPVLSSLVSSFFLPARSPPFLILTRRPSGPGQIERRPLLLSDTDFGGAPSARSPYGLRGEFFESCVHASWNKVSNFGIYYKVSRILRYLLYRIRAGCGRATRNRFQRNEGGSLLPPPPRNGERCADEDIDR